MIKKLYLLFAFMFLIGVVCLPVNTNATPVYPTQISAISGATVSGSTYTKIGTYKSLLGTNPGYSATKPRYMGFEGTQAGKYHKLQLKVTFPSNTPTTRRGVIYSVDNTTIASVSSTGLLTPKKTGQVKVKVTSKSNPKVYKYVYVRWYKP